MLTHIQVANIAVTHAFNYHFKYLFQTGLYKFEPYIILQIIQKLVNSHSKREKDKNPSD